MTGLSVVIILMDNKDATIDFKEFLVNLLSRLSDREQEVITKRYQLTNDLEKKSTLKKIGDSYSITRERVRQIERDAIKKLVELKKEEAFSQPLSALATDLNSFISKKGGIVREDQLLNDYVKPNHDLEFLHPNAYIFVFDNLLDNLEKVHNHDNFQNSWKINDLNLQEVAELLKLSAMLNKKPDELSGGQQQRVAVARLLATKPPVFLMDEPLSNLDARLRLDMRSELKRLHHETGVTTIYVTHDQTEAMTMASRIVVMNSGKIQQIASPKEIYHKPANLFVADFVGMPRINMFPAEMTQEKDQSYLFIDGLKIKMASSNTYSNLVAAVRPESIQIYNEQEQDSIDYEVYSVLPAGPELFVMAKKGNQNILIRETRQIDLEMGQTIWIKIDPLAVNLYDKDSGLLLNPS